MDLPTIKLIRQASKGSGEAINGLLRLIKDEHMPQRLYRWERRNVLLDMHDIESEFLLGVFLATSQVDPDKGNPLLYLLWRGEMKVVSHCRKVLGRGLVARCSCGYRGRPGYRSGGVICPTCGSGRIRTKMRMVSMENDTEDEGVLPDSFSERMTLDEIAIERDLLFDKATHAIAISEIRSRLEGRRLELFDLLVLEDINGQTARNYLKEIGRRFGVSPQRVSQYLRDLRAEILRYYEAGA